VLIKHVKQADGSIVWRFYIFDELSPYYEIKESAGNEALTFGFEDTERRVVGQMQGYPDGVNEIKEAIKTNMEKIGYPEQDLDGDFRRL
jgi:hypothetical protein